MGEIVVNIILCDDFEFDSTHLSDDISKEFSSNLDGDIFVYVSQYGELGYNVSVWRKKGAEYFGGTQLGYYFYNLSFVRDEIPKVIRLGNISKIGPTDEELSKMILEELNLNGQPKDFDLVVD